MDVVSAAGWIERLRLAWTGADGEAAAALFTTGATYRSHPFRIPLQGRDDIARYWSTAAATQHDLNVRFGAPLVDGDRVAVEWWATSVEGVTPQTDCGALILRFEGELCVELREYWNVAESRVEAPVGWGL